MIFFNSEKLVNEFLLSIKSKIFRSNTDFYIRCGFSLKNMQASLTDDDVSLTNSRYWSTELIQTKSFNDFVFFSLRESILKRVINNGLTGSSWFFKRFLYINVKTIKVSDQFIGNMADFVLSEAEVEDNVCDDVSVVSEERESNREFIDDAEYDESVENYRAFDNVSRDYNDAINDSLFGFDFSQEATDYYSDDDEIEEAVVNNFKDSKKKVDEFQKTLVNPHGDNNPDSFFCKSVCNSFSIN